MFLEKGILKKCNKLTGEHPCRSKFFSSVVYYAIITNVSTSVDKLEYVIKKIGKDLTLTLESTNIRAWRHI